MAAIAVFQTGVFSRVPGLVVDDWASGADTAAKIEDAARQAKTELQGIVANSRPPSRHV